MYLFQIIYKIIRGTIGILYNNLQYCPEQKQPLRELNIIQVGTV